ncbi:MAG: hypothetical protein ACJA0T_001790 [Colwellia sp.]|jgi:hypothetical protein
MSILLSDKHKTDPNRILKAKKNETKQSAKNSTDNLYVLKVTNVNRINSYLKNLLLNSLFT